MTFVRRARRLRLKASAGFRIAASKVVSAHQSILEAASAMADPLSPAVIGIRTTLYHGKQSEYLPRGIVGHARTASARYGMPAAQVVSMDEAFDSALTFAVPPRFTLCRIRATIQNGKIPERTARQVIKIIDLHTFPAGSGMSRDQVTLVNQPLAAARATAEPAGLTAWTFRPAADNRQCTESLMFQVK
jgi:hypothetical protein